MDEQTDHGDGLRGMPEMLLIGAAFRQAVEDAVKRPSKRASVHKCRQMNEDRQDAIRWLMSDAIAPEGDGLSARYCADLLGIELEAVRDEITHRPAQVRASLYYRQRHARPKQVA